MDMERGRGTKAPTIGKSEKISAEEKIRLVKEFIAADMPQRNKLTIDPILGLSPHQATRIQEQKDEYVARIEQEHEADRDGIALSPEQQADFLLEDIIAWGMHYDVSHPSDNFKWLGEEGDGFLAAGLHDKAGYRTDDIGILPGTDKTPPIPFCINATTGEGIGPLKKFWLSLYDLTVSGHFGVVPMVSVKIRKAPTAQAAGLVGAPRVTLAASRAQVMEFVSEVMRLKQAKEHKEREDAADEHVLTNALDDTQTTAERKTRARIIERRRTIETVEEGIRMHELQLQFAVQMLAQFDFFRRFAIMHRRRAYRALYSIEHAGQELSTPAHERTEDASWGMFGTELPKTAEALRILQNNLNETVDQLGYCLHAGKILYQELVDKLYASEREQEKPQWKRHKRFARGGSLTELTSNDPTHLALMALLDNTDLQKKISKLTYTDFGFKAPPKTKMW